MTINKKKSCIALFNKHVKEKRKTRSFDLTSEGQLGKTVAKC